MTTALATRDSVNINTGEIVTMARDFDMKSYLHTVSGNAALAEQHELARAYDAACAALIGPNDVQLEGARSFKKKSAWRKLAKHFRISVDIVKVESQVLSTGDFLATVTARGVSPWGQSSEDVGGCCTDEATGKRVITIADAIATASTRAINRAVSNLIAMGEVSAEEITRRPDAPRPSNGTPRPPAVAAPAHKRTGGPVMPFGKTKGVPLAELPTPEIESALEWARSKEKFVEFQKEAEDELELRSANAEAQRPAAVAATSTVQDDYATMMAELED